MKILFENARIIHVACGDSRGIGGAERQQWLLARALARHGHEVVVYSLAAEPAAEQRVEDVIFRTVTPARPVSAWPKILREERPDWWYQRGSGYYLGLCSWIAHAYGSRVVFACAHDNDCLPRRALTRRKYLWFLYALGLRSVDRILVQHRGQHGMLDERLRRKASLVPSVAVAGKQVESRKDYVAWIASLRETKRPHLVAEIAREMPRTRFIVCGPPTTSYTSRGYAETIVDTLRSCPNIEYRGRVSPVEAQEVIENAALFLSTADAEGFPNTFLQAWGSGVPVVSLDLDPGGVLAAHRTGFRVDGAAAAVEAIRRLLDDPGLNGELGANGSRYIREHHAEDAVVEAFTAALRNPGDR